MARALEQIEVLEASLKGGMRNANALPELLALTQSAHPATAARAMEAAARVFTRHGIVCPAAAAVDLARQPGLAGDAEAASALQTVRRFYRGHYDSFRSQLLDLLRTTDDDKTKAALHVLMDLVAAESSGDRGDGRGPQLSVVRLNGEAFGPIADALVDPTADKVSCRHVCECCL